MAIKTFLKYNEHAFQVQDASPRLGKVLAEYLDKRMEICLQKLEDLWLPFEEKFLAEYGKNLVHMDGYLDKCPHSDYKGSNPMLKILAVMVLTIGDIEMNPVSDYATLQALRGMLEEIHKA